jgi:hypothetical protein
MLGLQLKIFVTLIEVRCERGIEYAQFRHRMPYSTVDKIERRYSILGSLERSRIGVKCHATRTIKTRTIVFVLCVRTGCTDSIDCRSLEI